MGCWLISWWVRLCEGWSATGFSYGQADQPVFRHISQRQTISLWMIKPVPSSLRTYGTSLGIGGCGWGEHTRLCGPWVAGWSAGGLDYVEADQPPGSVMDRLISLYFDTSPGDEPQWTPIGLIRPQSARFRPNQPQSASSAYISLNQPQSAWISLNQPRSAWISPRFRLCDGWG
jgi:hypothetical protein